MDSPAEKAGVPTRATTLSTILRTADLLGTPAVVILTFVVGCQVGCAITLVALNVVMASLDAFDSHFGHFGAFQLNLAALAWAFLGSASGLAMRRRPILGFAISAAATLAIASFIALQWHEPATGGTDEGDVAIFLGPLVTSSAAVALSLIGLTFGVALRIRRRGRTAS